MRIGRSIAVLFTRDPVLEIRILCARATKLIEKKNRKDQIDQHSNAEDGETTHSRVAVDVDVESGFRFSRRLDCRIAPLHPTSAVDDAALP